MVRQCRGRQFVYWTHGGTIRADIHHGSLTSQTPSLLGQNSCCFSATIELGFHGQVELPLHGAPRWRAKVPGVTKAIDFCDVQLTALGVVKHVHRGYHDGEENEIEKELKALF